MVMVFGLELGDGINYSHWADTFLTILLEAGRGISAKTHGLDDVFPPDDLGSGP